MSILDSISSLDTKSLLGVAAALVLIVHVVPYLIDPHRLRSYPGPFLAKFSDAWLGRVAAQCHRSEVVHQMHKKYGTFVRIAPNHLSIASPDAIQTVYAHGNGTLKSNFYDAFVSIRRGLFNTRDRAQHARKRKIVSHVFSQKSVLEFQPHVRLYVGQLIQQWDRLCALAEKGTSGSEGTGWVGREGWLWLDVLPWYNYLAFDIIGDLAFGSPFGMLLSAKDAAPVATKHTAAMASYGSSSQTIQTLNIPAVQILNDRGEYSASMGVLPPWVRPLIKKFHPWYRNGQKAVTDLAGLAVAAVAKRLGGEETGRVDLLSKLRAGKDEEGRPMGREELTAEALTQLIAGSDTTSNSSCAITYHLAKNPSVQSKLHAELDSALPSSDEDPAAYHDQIKSLPYLTSVINETLRLHSTSGVGLPRVVPEGGLEVLGRWFPEGTVLSVPTYTVHRDEGAWGDDVDVFRPERWEGVEGGEAHRAFNPFSFGPRGCVGRNLASMELLIIIASILRRYEFVLEKPDAPFETREGFLRKPIECGVGIKRRHA